MSNDNSKGFSGSLFLGLGFGALVTMPFYLAYRLGGHFMALLAALWFTGMAIFSDDLLNITSRHTICSGLCSGETFSKLIAELHSLGFWHVAIISWLMFILITISAAVFQSLTRKIPN